LFNTTILSQDDGNSDRKCFVGVWPSEVDHVNGVMFNFWDKTNTKPEDGEFELPTTNGLELILNPLGIMTVPISLFVGLGYPNAKKPFTEEEYNLEIEKEFKKVNGLLLALLNLESTSIKGVEINLSGSLGTIIKGVSIGATVNKRYELNGLGVGIGNFDTKVNGVQIGVLNTSLKLKGIQIGLWNKNEKRSLPFINWNF